MFCTKVSTIIVTGYQHFDLIETRPAAFSVARSSQIETPVWLIEMKRVENIVILTIEPKAILWYRRIVLYGSIGPPEAKFTKRTDSWRHLRWAERLPIK